MAIICPNFNNPDVAREFNELKEAIGEKAAYAVWSLNNGNGIELDPNGGPSRLFQDLVNFGYTREEAIRIKANVYTNSYLATNNWLELSTVIEPSASDARAYAGDTDFMDASTEKAINEIENSPMLEAELEKEFQEWRLVHGDDRHEFYTAKLQQAKASLIHNLTRNFKSGFFRNLFKSEETKRFQEDLLRVIDLMLDNPDYSDIVVDMLKDMVYGTDFSLSPKHSLYQVAKVYVNTFWSSDLIITARNQYMKSGADEIDAENKIIELVVNYFLGKKGTLASKIVNGIRNKYFEWFGNRITRLAAFKGACHDIARAMAINKAIDINYSRLSLAPYSKYSNFEISSETFDNKTIIDQIINLCEARLKFLRLNRNSNIDEINEIKARLKELKSINYNNQGSVDSGILSFINKAYKDIGEAVDFINDCFNADPSTYDIDKLVSVKENIIKGYQRLIDRYMLSYTLKMGTTNAMYSSSGSIFRELNNLSQDLNKAIVVYDDVESKWGEWFISDFIDKEFQGKYETLIKDTTYDLNGNRVTKLVPISEKYKKDARLFLHNRIRNTRLSNYLHKAASFFGANGVLDRHLMYASSSYNPIVRIIDKMIRLADMKTHFPATEKQKTLTDLYKKAISLKERFSMSNFMKNFIEVRKDGTYTANFKSPVNVGQYEHEFNLEKQAIVNEVIIPVVEDLVFLQQHKNEFRNTSNSTVVQNVINRVRPYFPHCMNIDDIYEYLNTATISFSWKADEYKFETEDPILNKVYLDAIDDFMGGYSIKTGTWGPIRKHRRFLPAYYKARRNFLSPSTEAAYEKLTEQIDAIRLKCYNEEIGFYDLTKLSRPDKARLQSLETELSQMSSIYSYTILPNGTVDNIVEKTGDARRIANELTAWHDFLYHSRNGLHANVERVNDLAKFQEIYNKIKAKFGNNSPEAISFYNNNVSLIETIDKTITDSDGKPLTQYGDLPQVLKDLYHRRLLILNATKTNMFNPNEQPNLDKLSISAWRELIRIENAISLEKAKRHNSLGMTNPDFIEELERVSSIEPVINPATGVAFVSEFKQRYSHNMAAYLATFMRLEWEYDKQNNRVYLKGYTDSDAFFYRKYVSSRYTPELSLSNEYKTLDVNSLLVDNEYEEDDEFFNIDKDLYRDLSYFDMADDPKKFAYYEELINTMQEAWSYLPDGRMHYKYQMPQMLAESTAANIFKKRSKNKGDRGIRELYKDLHWRYDSDGNQISELNESLQDDFTRTASGEKATVIPIKWTKPLFNDSWAVETDITKSVVKFYEMALNFKNKKDIESAANSILSIVNGGFKNQNDPISTKNAQRLEDHVQAYIYNKQSRGFSLHNRDLLSGFELFCYKVARNLNKWASKSFLNMNLTSALKNALDSICSIIRSVVSAAHLGPKVFGKGLKYLVLDFFKAVRNPGSTNSTSWTSAAIQHDKVHEGVEYTASGTNKWFIRKFIDRFIEMGPLLLIDYTAKGLLINATYCGYRLVLNPNTNQYQFVTKKQARLMYMGKYSKQEGNRAWNKSEISLRDAYYVDEKGVFTVKPQYQQYIDTNFQTTVASRVQERSSVINGMFSAYSKTATTMNILGSLFLLMRGWAMTQFVDHVKSGDDTADFVEVKSQNGTIDLNAPLEKINRFDDVTREFEGLFNFASGEFEKGNWIGGIAHTLITLPFSSYTRARVVDTLKRLWNGVTLLNLADNLDDHTLERMRNTMAAILLMFANIAASYPTAQWVESANQNVNSSITSKFNQWAANFVYTGMSGVQGELLSLLGPVGFLCATADFIASPFTSGGYVKDVVTSITPILSSCIEYVFSDGSLSKYLNEEIKDYSYAGLTNAERDALRISRLTPGLNKVNVHNLVQSIRIPALEAKYKFMKDLQKIPFVPDGYQPFVLFSPKTGKDLVTQDGLIPSIVDPKNSSRNFDKDGKKKKNSGSNNTRHIDHNRHL